MKTINITDSVFGVVVPKEIHVSMFDYAERNGKIYLINHGNRDEIYIPGLDGFDYDDFEQIGLCKLPSLVFDFEVDESWVSSNKKSYLNYHNSIYYFYNKEDSFSTRIQKAIQDAGLLLVNPIHIPIVIDVNEYNKLIEQWQESESKVIKGNLLIISKIK